MWLEKRLDGHGDRNSNNHRIGTVTMLEYHCTRCLFIGVMYRLQTQRERSAVFCFLQPLTLSAIAEHVRSFCSYVSIHSYRRRRDVKTETKEGIHHPPWEGHLDRQSLDVDVEPAPTSHLKRREAPWLNKRPELLSS